VGDEPFVEDAENGRVVVMAALVIAPNAIDVRDVERIAGVGRRRHQIWPGS